MSVTDAFVVGEDWIGEHYFGSDAKSQSFHARLVALRKAWDAAEADGEPTPRRNLISARGALEAALARVPSPADTGERPAVDVTALRETVTRPILDALGFVDGPARSIERDGPVQWVTALGDEHPALAIVEAKPVEAAEALLQKDERNLTAPFEAEGEKPIASVARLLSSIFLADHAPAFALVTAGPWLLLAERERWAEGRYLAIDVQAVLSRNDVKKAGEVDRLLACVSAETLLPSPDGTTWWRETLDDSAKHTVSVSKDLREGVRRSIELIANEVVRRRRTKGLEPLPADQAQPLARQSLRYIYRILFLLYAEASPEMGVLPLATGDYEEGYSLDRLRDLLLVPIDPDDDGTHLHASLGVLFRLVDDGAEQRDLDEVTDGLQFESLKADLFVPSAISMIAEVGLGDGALHQVLSMLLLSKEQRGKDRGFISYAELGINQLGAVYEGLMSYTGFFAETHLHEVAKGGDASKGSWVVPTDRSGDLSPEDFVKRPDANGAMVPVVHEPGSFVFRLAGRERQQSASYYTPEVLTRFTVSQALEELLDQNGTRTSAEEILGLTVCEPALGSGAFAIEATRQLAEEYLKRRQEELDERIEPDDYARELQKVKAHIALHNVYGVDLNATAVELAEVSLWLDTMVSGLQAPWFGLHLRRGNSLIGARRAVYSLEAVRSKSWLQEAPRDVPMTSLRADLDEGRLGSGLAGGIHHFLLPAEGWGAGADAKEAKELAPDAVKRLQAWRRSLRTKPSKQQVTRLQSLAMRVETLWQFALRRIEIAEREIRRDIAVWGQNQTVLGGVSRAAVEAALFEDRDGPYARLRLAMDAWCSLWFWPLDATVAPPTWESWLGGLELLLGKHSSQSARATAAGRASIVPGSDWAGLESAEALDLSFAGAAPVREAQAEHDWLDEAERIATERRFFHWELDFSTVFAGGGFDLHVGNPPWVRPTMSLKEAIADEDPFVALAVTASDELSAALQRVGRAEVVRRLSDHSAMLAALASPVTFAHSAGGATNLYKCFMVRAWQGMAEHGVVGFVHPAGHLVGDGDAALRRRSYRHLARLWMFVNQRKLFDEVGNTRPYTVSVYTASDEKVHFDAACGILTPSTIEGSLRHDGTGAPPAVKYDDGSWNLAPHRDRIFKVDRTLLSSWARISGDPIDSARFIETRTAGAARALTRFAETFAYRGDTLKVRPVDERQTQRVRGATTPRDMTALHGPMIGVLNPRYQQVDSARTSHRDAIGVDLEALSTEEAYKPRIAVLPAGKTEDSAGYRLAWRSMLDPQGERTFIPTILPPGPEVISTISSCRLPDHRTLVALAGVASSLLSDHFVRSAAPSGSLTWLVDRLPLLADAPLGSELLHRVMRLVALTSEFDHLWSELYQSSWAADCWSIPHLPGMAEEPMESDQNWSSRSALRRASTRWMAQVEIDVIVALSTGITQNDLNAVYIGEFGVLRDADQRRVRYDARGRRVPSEIAASDAAVASPHPTSNVIYAYEPPFIALNREQRMAQAFSHFERLLQERS